MSVGSVAVQLKYGLYVGQLSKLAFQFMFKSSVWSLLCSLLGLLVTDRALRRGLVEFTKFNLIRPWRKTLCCLPYNIGPHSKPY